jgi:hypothetical protein
LFPAVRIVVAAAAVLAVVPAGSAATPAWQAHSLTGGGSISLPETWQNFTRQTPQLQNALREEVARNPRIAPLLYALTARRSQLVRFVAADLAPRSLRRGFVTNVNVLAQRTQATLDQWAATNASALRRIRTVVKPVRRSTVHLPAGRAVHLRYVQRVQTGARVSRVSVTQYAVTRNRTIYLLTFTTSPGQLLAYRPVFQLSAFTLRLR